MRSEEIHEVVGGAFRVSAVQSFAVFPHKFDRAVFHVVNDRASHGIIHHGVKLAAVEIRSSAAVADFVRRILPNFADENAVRIVFLDSFAELFEKSFVKLVSYVKSPPRHAEFHPFFDNFIAYERAESLVASVNSRENFDAPPALVVVGKFSERIPTVIR